MPERYPLIRNQFFNPEINPNLMQNFLAGTEIPSPTRLQPNPCWLRTGSPGNHNYSQFSIIIPGRGRKPALAHRVAFALQFGEMPINRNACHLCQNTNCANPSHIVDGSQRFNIQDQRWNAQFSEGERAQMGHVIPPFRPWTGFGLEEYERFFEVYQTEMVEEFELQFLVPEIRLNLR